MFWRYYNEVVTVACDICSDTLSYSADDVYEADEQARNEDWQVDVEVHEDKHYDHICYSCSEELHYCGICEVQVWCEEAQHCDETYCSLECLDIAHQDWGKDNPGELSCEECEWENPHATSDAPKQGAWAVA